MLVSLFFAGVGARNWMPPLLFRFWCRWVRVLEGKKLSMDKKKKAGERHGGEMNKWKISNKGERQGTGE